LNASILAKLSLGYYTNFSSIKNIHITARLKYIEHKTPKSDANLRVLTLLGIDIGNIIPNAKTAAETILPVSFSPNNYNNYLSVEYRATILGTAFLT